jgi:hypothetical protein
MLVKSGIGNRDQSVIEVLRMLTRNSFMLG